jgi:CHAT domain-containing protein
LRLLASFKRSVKKLLAVLEQAATSSADLVALSSCDTGNGRLLGQEGIASLWTEDDGFTTSLMKRFYQHLVDGQDKGSALRQAKLDLLQKFGDTAVPVYRASVVLGGDGSTQNVG